MNLKQEFFRSFLPSRCIICDTPILEEGYCRRCKGLLNPIDKELCAGCGMVITECSCDKYIMHYDGIVAPYFNEGYAQEAIYNLKFAREQIGQIESPKIAAGGILFISDTPIFIIEPKKEMAQIS